MDKEKWIGLAEVSPAPACEELQLPAMVNVIGLAWGADDFIDLVRSECATIGLELIEIEDVETWENRIANWQPAPEVRSMADAVCEDHQFAFGTFYTFDEE